MLDRPSSFALHRLVTPHYHRDPSSALLLISPYHIQGNPTANHPSFDSHSRVTPRNPRRLSSASLIISPVTRNEKREQITHPSLLTCATTYETSNASLSFYTSNTHRGTQWRVIRPLFLTRHIQLQIFDSNLTAFVTFQIEVLTGRWTWKCIPSPNKKKPNKQRKKQNLTRGIQRNSQAGIKEKELFPFTGLNGPTHA